VIVYILRNEDEPRQYDMLQAVCTKLLAMNRTMFFHAIDSLYEILSYCRNIGCFFLLVWFMHQENKTSDMYYIRRYYNTFIDKRQLYQTEIMTLENISP
jgi:hypothetical protein